MENDIKKILLELQIIQESSLEKYFPRTRDNENISVMRCRKSEVIFLENCDHVDNLYYEQKDQLSYWNQDTYEKAKLDTYNDDIRRSDYIKSYIKNKKWVDIGTGIGGILDINKTLASEIHAVEPQAYCQKIIAERGYKIVSNAAELPQIFFDTATLFHVFEHMKNPLTSLKVIYEKIKQGGHLIIEVPHAKDALISWFKLEDFKKFTFWSEHLILHTRESLRKFVEAAGFIVESIEGVQRYPLANHLYWLSEKKPGGHEKWGQFSNPSLNNEYANALAKLDMTDTLLLFARKDK